MLIKIQPDATVNRYLFTAKSLYMFRVSQHPSWVLKTVTAASGTGHNIGTDTSLQRGPIGPRLLLTNYLSLGHSSSFFPSHFPTKRLHVFLTTQNVNLKA